MHAFWTAFIFIFLAEMGDKTQLMTLALSTRYKSALVMAAVIVGTLAVTFVSAAVGSTVGKLLPFFWIDMFAGALFILFGLLELKGEDVEREESEATKIKTGRFGPIAAIAAAFFVAEIGDKTMLATIAIAGHEANFLQVWLGSTGGLVSANALAIGAGKAIGKKLSGKTLRYSIAAVYIFSGLLAVIDGLQHRM